MKTLAGYPNGKVSALKCLCFASGGKEMRRRLPITVDNTPMTWQTMAMHYINLDDIVKVACEFNYTKVAVAKKFAGPQWPNILFLYGE